MSSPLILEIITISVIIAVLSSAPVFSERLRKHSKLYFLLGTGALGGLCLFEILPEIFHMGGVKSLAVAGGVWALYAVLHHFHIGHPEHHGHIDKEFSTVVFLGSMIVHCLTSGMLLVLSSDMDGAIEGAGGGAGGFQKTVFLALLAHKTYEALAVSSILMTTQKKRRNFLISIVSYSLSFPVGAGLTWILSESITKPVAMIAMSLAVGTLLGCLIFDFMIPSLTHVRQRKTDLKWIILGLAVTQVVFLFL